MKLCLGTVQFGMDYGIKGKKQPPLADSLACLDYAVQNGITAIDTAQAYGNAEEITGIFLAKKNVAREDLYLSTKLRPNILDDVSPDDYEKIIRENLIRSLSVLHTDYIDVFLLHSARYAFNPEILSALKSVQKEGLAGKVGVSVYEPDEAKTCFQNPDVSVIQMPYSLFDHRMKENDIFQEGAECGFEMHIRSVFLQGLVTMDTEQVPPFLKKAVPIVRRINEISQETGISKIALAMAYAKRETAVKSLVFGVHSLDQLKEDIQLFEADVPENALLQIEQEFKGLSADIVLPSLWKKS